MRGASRRGAKRSGVPASSALRVLVCGCGAVTERFYAPAFHALEAEGLIRIVGLVDASDQRVAHVGADFPTARQYRHLDQGLADAVAELVIVATPHQFHKDHTIASLLAGNHVLCEKPLALSSSDCDEMIGAAERVGCLLGVGHFRRFFPSVQAIRSAIEAGVMGRLVSFAAFEGEIYRWPVTWPSSYARGANARGVFTDIGPHALDLLSWWLGELRMVSYSDDAVDGIEVNCRADLETVDGARGALRMSRDTVLPNRHLITFERGWLAYKCDVPDQFELGWSGAPHRARRYPGRAGADVSDVGFPVLRGAGAPRERLPPPASKCRRRHTRHRAVARLGPRCARWHRPHRALLRSEVTLERTLAWR